MMRNFSLKESLNAQQLMLIAFCCLMFVYVVLRAFNVPFTFDEISTARMVESEEWTNFGDSANNHLLNTVLMKGTRLFFDASVMCYRLPNVLAFILFLVYSVRLGHLLTPAKQYLTAVLLVSMPFLIDFFSLARGYGLSISFLVVSIYYALQFTSQLKTSHLIFTLLFGMGAVVSNYALLHFFLPLLFVLFLFILTSKGKRGIHLIICTTILTVFFSLVTPIFFQLKEGNHLFFGGRDDFFSSVVFSLGRCFGYGNFNSWIPETVFAMLFIVACCFSIATIYSIIKERKTTESVVLPILFVLSILSPIAQHILFGTFYPAERTALLYYPLMILVIVQGLGIYFIRLHDIVLKVMTFVFIAHFICTINISHTYSWRFESGTRNILSYLKGVGETAKGNVSLGTDYVYIPSTWFYKMSTNFHELETHQVIGCWEFSMGIEELNPTYYGPKERSKKYMSRDDIERIFSDNFDYYYLNGYTVRELERNEISFSVVLSERNANAYLIKLE